MNISPINTEAAYESALKEIESLFDASPGTPEGDRLEILITLVEEYEDKHYVLPPPDPEETLAYYLESQGLTHPQP